MKEKIIILLVLFIIISYTVTQVTTIIQCKKINGTVVATQMLSCWKDGNFVNP